MGKYFDNEIVDKLYMGSLTDARDNDELWELSQEICRLSSKIKSQLDDEYKKIFNHLESLYDKYRKIDNKLVFKKTLLNSTDFMKFIYNEKQ